MSALVRIGGACGGEWWMWWLRLVVMAHEVLKVVGSNRVLVVVVNW